jgi:hypothetical protein
MQGATQHLLAGAVQRIDARRNKIFTSKFLILRDTGDYHFNGNNIKPCLLVL